MIEPMQLYKSNITQTPSGTIATSKPVELIDVIVKINEIIEHLNKQENEKTN